ncbi:MAG: phage/plasmid primase, P4 family, partial [Terriglobales bacterium]
MTTTSTNATDTAIFNNLPGEMRARRSWVGYKLEPGNKPNDPAKVPYQLNGLWHASSTNPGNWDSFEASCAAVSAGTVDGPSYAMQAADGLVCIDLDHVRDPETGEVLPSAQEILQQTNSYSELSPSRTGFHILVRATIPKNAHPAGSWVEMYFDKKIMSCTGQVEFLHDSIEARDVSELFKRVEAGEFAPKPAPKSSKPSTGDTSAAEFALACKIARQVGCDPEKTKAEFLKQAPPRDKLRREDYVQRTVDKAIEAVMAGQNHKRPTVEMTIIPPNSDSDYGLTDAGNGARFVAKNGSDVRYCKQRDKFGWYVWNGQRWCPDSRGTAMELARQTALDIITEAVELQKSETEAAGRMVKWGYASLAHKKLSDMLAQAGAGTSISIDGADFDRHPHLLNLQNGTMDLQTMEFYPARKEDLLTQIANVAYDPSADYPRWMKFLDDVTQGDAEMMTYLQRVSGYLLTGSQSEQCFFLFYGPGGTGKSTYWKTHKGMMGDYFAIAADGLFVKGNRFNRPTGHGATPGLTALVGKRVAATVEMEEGDRFNTKLLRSITGGDSQEIRPLYAPLFNYLM